MKRLEVRCCCNPNKVLGHLAHPRLQALGDSWSFAVLDNTRPPEVFVLAGTVHQQVPMKQITLHVDRFSDGRGVVCEAIKNSDYELADLKGIRGFEPATWEPGNG